MRTLLAKELRSLAPFLGLVLFFAALNWVELLLSEFPDQQPLSRLFSDREIGQVVAFIVAFALASGLLMRERDDGTLSFLDALPVSRTRIFLAKFVLALAVLWLIPLSDLVYRATVHAWSRTSLETRFQWPLLTTAALLEAASCFVYLSVGLALSFLRRFSLLVLGLLVCAYLLLQECQVPYVSLFNLFTLCEPVFQGQRWLLPAHQLAVQLALGAACVALALGAFLAMGDPAQRFAERARRRRGWILLAGLGTTLAVGIWVGLLVYFVKRTADREKPEVHYAEWPTARAHTARFEFLYPDNQTGFVNPLLDRADVIEARVRGFLGAQPIGRIEADLTGSAPHTAGQAHWKKVQLDLAAAGHDPDNLAAIFAHETAHVYIDHESQSRLADDFNATRFFHEGLASFIEHRLFRNTNELASQRRVAATMRARHEVKIEELLDDKALTLKRDPDLVYPLGEMFVAALVLRHGEAAPGQVVRAFARPSAPKDLEGFALWQDTLQACGYNLSGVVETFFAELDRAVAGHRDFIESLPRLRGAVQEAAGKIALQPIYEGPAPGTVVCRFRARADTPERFYEYADADDRKVFRVNKSGYPERSFWYQLGWRVPGASQPIYESWVEAHQRP